MSPSAQAEKELDQIVDATLAVPIDDDELGDTVLEGRPRSAILAVLIVPCCRDDGVDL